MKRLVERTALLFTAMLGLVNAALAAGSSDPTYNRDIRPILSENCFACHGPDAKHRKADLRTGWPWRDWVIDAFNLDMQFDQFVVEQLAGDLLPDAKPMQALATAFHTTNSGRDNYWLRQWPALSNDRPILAMAAGKWGVHPWSRCFSQALEPEAESELLVSHIAAERWTVQKYTSGDEIGGIIAIDADCVTPGTPVKYWWVLGTNGLFRATEYPDKFTKVLKAGQSL